MKSAVLEGIGTFAIVLFGSLTVVPPEKEEDNQLVLVKAATMIFFATMAMMWISAKYSGSQFNPTLSLGLLVVGKLSMSNFVFNVIFQAIGGALGYLCLMGLTDVTMYTKYSNTFLIVILLEFIIAFFLCTVYFFTFVDKNASRAIYGFAVPATYAFLTMTLGRYHYTGYNFVMFFVASLLNFKLDLSLVYVAAGSGLGCLVAGLFYRFLYEKEGEKHTAGVFMMEDDAELNF